MNMIYRRVERCIYKSRSSRLFFVNKMYKSVQYTKSFHTIEDARKFRDSIVKSPKCKVCDTEIKSGNYCAKHYDMSKPMFDSFAHRLTVDELPLRDDVDNDIMTVICHKCKTRFVPSHRSVSQRIASIEGKKAAKGAKGYLYCSDKCKYSCEDFGFGLTNKPVRCYQQTNKQALLDNQLDTYGYTFCEICSKKVKPELHHGLMSAENPNETDNMAHQLLCCKECHKKFKNKGGC